MEKKYPAFTPSIATDGFPSKAWSNTLVAPQRREANRIISSVYSRSVMPASRPIKNGHQISALSLLSLMYTN